MVREREVHTLQTEHTIIVGAGPCGLSAAIELQKKGIKPLVLEKGNVVNTIYQFPTHQTFFSSSDRLEIGNHLFSNEKQKPVRIQALTYYRSVAERENVRLQPFEKVVKVSNENDHFILTSEDQKGIEKNYEAKNIVLATGYYDQPRYMDIPGEKSPRVMHYFKEGHPYFNQDVVVIGGKNSAVDATLELHKAGARVTVLYRGNDYSKSIKPWILPEFASLVRKEIVNMVFQAEVTEITEHKVHYTAGGKENEVTADFVFAMTGYQPNMTLLHQIGIHVDDKTGKPQINPETMETNIPGCYIAGVVAAGYNNNEIFIENGRYHGGLIAEHIIASPKKDLI